MKWLILIVVLIALQGCTGLNFRTWPIRISPNTHPVPSYAEGSVLYKGGFFFHKESQVTQVGISKAIKKGKACVHSLFYMGAWGDSRIDSAKVNGAISQPAFMEQEILAVLGGFIYHRHCTILIGE
jgi:hypothetical protein